MTEERGSLSLRPYRERAMKITVYSGTGVGERSLKETTRTFRRLFPQALVSHVSAEETRTTNWHRSTDLFVIPGGRDIPYCEALDGAGTDSIREFVLHGGRYLGLCAGAYFGCAKVEFERGTPNEVIGERSLRFFSGLAVGSALTAGAFNYANELSAKIALVSSDGAAAVKVYFDGGCLFVGDDRNASVVTRYLDLPNEPAAGVVCKVGSGKALLLGIHPEFSAVGDRALRPDLDAVLAANEQERDIFFRSLLTSLDVFETKLRVENA